MAAMDAETLKEQNDQLWRLVERQRAVIFQLREELDRLLHEQQHEQHASPAESAAADHVVATPPATPQSKSSGQDKQQHLLLASTPSGSSMSMGFTPSSALSSPVQTPSPLAAPPSATVAATATAASSSPQTQPLLQQQQPPQRAPQTTPPTQSQLSRLRSSLHLLSLPVVGTFVQPNSKGKETLFFVVGVRVADNTPSAPGSTTTASSVPSELWWISKAYSDLLAVETKARAAHKQYPHLSSLQRLPDKSLFSVSREANAAPAAVAQRADARRYAVEAFLAQIVEVVCEHPFGPLTNTLVEFVSADLHDPTTSVFSADAAPLLTTPTTELSAAPPLGPAPERRPGNLFGQDGGFARLFKKSSTNPVNGRTGQSATLSATTNAPNRGPPKPVFGVPLEQAIATSRIREGTELPAVVYRCIEYLDAQDASHEEGIYRLSGSTKVIGWVKEQFNANHDFDIVNCGEYIDVHAVAGVLKLFFRELPGSILTDHFNPYFASLQEIPSVPERIRELRILVEMLPIANYTVLRALIAHLASIVSQAASNKMTVRNIGIVFAPTLGIPAGIFSLMLMEFEAVFDVHGTAAAADAAAAAAAAAAVAEREERDAAAAARQAADDRQLHCDIDDDEGNGDHPHYGAGSERPTSSDDLVGDIVGGYGDDNDDEDEDDVRERSGDYNDDDSASDDIALRKPNAALHRSEAAMSASPRISVAIDDSSELGDMVAEMTLSAAASHPGSRTAAGTAAAGGARRSRNSLMYAATAPAALLQLERSITPMTADVAESGAVAMAVEADPLVASAHADAEYARVARAQNRVSHGYFGMYEPEALSYMQFVETSGLDRVATPVMTAGIRAANAAAATGGSLPRQVMFADGTLDGIPARSHLGSLSRNRSDSSASNSPGSGFLHRSGSTASDATERAMMGGPATSMAPVRGTSSRATKRESLYMAGSAPAPVSTAGLPSSATAIGSLTAASMMAAYGSSPTVSSSVGVLGAGSPISTPTGSPMGAVSPLAVAMATVGGAALPAGAASLSSRAVYTAEQNLQALLRTDKDSLSRELANMDPQQLAQLQALLRERSAAQTTSSQAGVSSSRPAAGY